MSADDGAAKVDISHIFQRCNGQRGGFTDGKVRRVYGCTDIQVAHYFCCSFVKVQLEDIHCCVGDKLQGGSRTH